MDYASTIRNSLGAVAQLRADAAADGQLGLAVKAVKQFQAQRFRACYADLLASDVFGAASRFFLDELYGEADFTERDSQFARIAGTLVTVFPASVVETAVALSHLHARTEQLDHWMASSFQQYGSGFPHITALSYASAWQTVARRPEREHQLADVLALGYELANLTRKPGLAVLLKIMRKPAASAGLGSLQRFLESGFVIFSTLARSKGAVETFLSTIRDRETAWLETMFSKQ